MTLSKTQLSVPESIRIQDKEAIAKLERISNGEDGKGAGVLIEFVAFGSLNSISTADGEDMDEATLKAAIEGAVELSRALAAEAEGGKGDPR